MEEKKTRRLKEQSEVGEQEVQEREEEGETAEADLMSLSSQSLDFDFGDMAC